MWSELPDLLLEEIFTYLSYKDRLSAGLVCKNWYATFLSPNIWKTFIVGEKTFSSRLSYNHYKKCYNTKVNPYKVQKWAAMIGCHIRTLIILPHRNFYHLYDFMNAFSSYIEYSGEYPMESLEHFKFTFACESRSYSGSEVIGTGGQILEALKRLLGFLQHLRSLTLNNLLLDVDDAPGLLEQVVKNCGHSLERLEVLNATKERYPLFYVGMFSKLRKLVITSLQLTDDVVQMVARHHTTKELLIVEDQYSHKGDPISPQTWEDVKHAAPHLKVRLEQRGKVVNDLTVQENAPVSAIVFHAPFVSMKGEIVNQIVRNYSSCLEIYAQLGLPKTFPPRSFRDRCDLHAVYMIQQCHKLHTLAINERISTATILKITEAARNLRRVYVRQNAVLLKGDWPKSSTWSKDYYDYWKEVVRSHDKTADDVSRTLGYKWTMLSDSCYKHLEL